MAENSEESVPLLAGVSRSDNQSPSEYYTAEGRVENGGRRSVVVNEEDSEEAMNEGHSNGGSSVNCRVCEAVIELEGRSTQHVVKCVQCMEATPIRPAPPGKKYVRCPCNCLLICKAASSRIACPRQNCRRVITLGQADMSARAMPEPTGTCRVACFFCTDIFMFNTLTNTLATCPHCKKRSSVGSAFRRLRITYYSIGTLLSLAVALGLLVGSVENAFPFGRVVAFGFTGVMLCTTCWLGSKVFTYFNTKVSETLQRT